MTKLEKARPERVERWWVVQQHDEFEVVRSEDQPSSEVQPDERLKHVSGPFRSRELAQKAADDTYSRTLKGMSERAGL